MSAIIGPGEVREGAATEGEPGPSVWSALETLPDSGRSRGAAVEPPSSTS